MPQGADWPDVGRYSPALGPPLPPTRRVSHHSIRGPQATRVEVFPSRHYQLSGYTYLHSSSWD